MSDELLAASQLLARRVAAPVVSPSERAQKLDRPGLADVLAQRLAGDSLRTIGRRHGLTGERIRQLLEEVDPQHTDKAMAARRAARQVRQDLAQVRQAEAAEAAGRECRICYGTVVGGRITCSPRCAELWRLCAYHLDDERRDRRRVGAARWVVANPDRVTSYQLRYAQGVLAGTTRRRGRWTNSAEIRQALDEVALLRGQDVVVR